MGKRSAAVTYTCHEARPDVKGGGLSTDVAECKTAVLRPTFRPLYRRLSASCVQWAVGPRWPTPRFRFWCFSTSASRPTGKVFGSSISKHHQSTGPDGGPFGGCSDPGHTQPGHGTRCTQHGHFPRLGSALVGSPHPRGAVGVPLGDGRAGARTSVALGHA